MQAPILGEGDEQDPVQQALGRLDRPVQLRLGVRPSFKLT